MDSAESDKIKVSGVRISIRLTVVTIFMLATACTAIVAVSMQFYFSSRLAKQHALERYQQTAIATANHIAAIDQQAKNAALVLAQYPNLIRDDWVSSSVKRVFRQVMINNPMFNAIHLGFANGDVYELINLDACETARKALQASPFDRWVAMTISGAGVQRSREFHYFDDGFTLRATRNEATDYDPTDRSWYTQAVTENVIKSGPYLFEHLQVPGQSFSIRMANHDAVLAVDMTLSPLSKFIRNIDLGAHSGIFVYQPSGAMIASNAPPSTQGGIPGSEPLPLTKAERRRVQALKPLKISNELDWPPIDFAVAGQPQGYAIDVIRLIQQQTGIPFHFVNGYQWTRLVEKFHLSELDALQPVLNQGKNYRTGVFSEPFIEAGYSAAVPKGTPAITSFEQLRGKRVAIPSGWSLISVLKRDLPEVTIIEVSTTREALLKVGARQADAALDNDLVLKYTARQFYIDNIDIYNNLDRGDVSIDTDFRILIQSQYADLLPIINRAISGITQAQKQALNEKWLAIGLSPASAKTKGTVPYPFLLTNNNALQGAQTSSPQLKEHLYKQRRYLVYQTAVNHGAKELFAVVVPTATVMAQVIDQTLTAVLGTGLVLLLLLPTAGWFASPIVNPIMQLVNKSHLVRQRRYNEFELDQSRITEICDLELAITDMAGSIQQHEQAQAELMESIVRLIAQAIDDKSPYTGGHCARVPVLGIMLAEAADASTAPPFKDFRFANSDEKREFRLAAWLHDCGKITTPEHIIDKGVKLETIYNRLHEVRMRFEVLWRDLEIEHLHRLIQASEQATPKKSPSSASSLEEPSRQECSKQELLKQRQQLQDDFAFIAALNLGAESVAPEQLERLHRIAQRTWTRHFSNRIGLSPVESARFSDLPPTLPVQEPLLSNREEHIIDRHTPLEFAPELGINMEVPKHLYNLGELYNLSVSRGTLTKEDRFKINEHMISTIKMLEGLPFPEELKRVPRYASTHHETMKGTGYPRKLPGKALSIPERVLVVADIYEALTAADRPYKKAKTVSESLAILHRMALNNHVDWDVFRLFLTSGVYKAYSERFLPPSQRDDVDIERLLQDTPLS